MKKLCFGSIATVLGFFINEVFSKMDLCDAMFSSVVPETDFTASLTDSNRTDMFGGRNPIPHEVSVGVTRSSPVDIAKRFKDFVLPMIDDNKRKQIIAILKDIIADDEDVTDVTEIEYVNHAQKGSIANQTTFVFHEFVAGIYIYSCRVKNTNLIRRVKEIDEDYVNSFADQADDIHLVDSYVALPPELTDMTHTHELVLLAQANGKCMACGRPVALETEMGETDRCQIVHTKDENGIDVDLVLCVDCARDYANAPSEYLQNLLRRRSYQKAQMEALNAIGAPQQKKAIEEAIRKLAALNLKHDAELKYEPTAIKNKIVGDSKLLDDVIWNANYWFRAINTEIENAAEAKILSPERFSKSFARMYDDVSEVAETQRMAYDTIVTRLAGMIGTEYKSQCECIVSDFVQSCEVFDEVTKQDDPVQTEHNSPVPKSPLNSAAG